MALRFDRIEITGTSTSESTPSITNSSNELIRFQTTSGYVDIGANNTGYTHFYTDRNKFYFNKKLIVDEGMISAYNEDLTLAVNDGANTVITIDKDSPYNVGIGVTSPSQKLEVAGNGLFGNGNTPITLQVGEATGYTSQTNSTLKLAQGGGNYHEFRGLRTSDEEGSIYRMQEYTDGQLVRMTQTYDGETTHILYGDNLSLSSNVIITGDLTVNGGDITLGGTGRIQGVDTVSASTDAVNKAYVDDNAAPYVKFSRTGINSSTYTMIATVNGDNLASIIKMTMTGTSANVVFACTFDITVNHLQDIHVKSMNGDYTEVTLRITSNNNEDFSIEAKHNGSTTTTAEVCIFPLANEVITPTTTDPGYTGAEYEHTATEGWHYGGEDGNVESSNVVFDGKVGIGTTSPGSPLHVAATGLDTAAGALGVHIGVHSSTYAGIEIVSNGSNSGWIDFLNVTGGGDYKERIRGGGGNFEFHTNGSQKMCIESSGNVGIGDTNPDAKLTVLRTDNTYAINLSNTEARAGLSVKSSGAFDSKLTISSGASSRQYIQAMNNAATTGRDIVINPYGGNVGIGTASPGVKLDVEGRFRVQGNGDIALDVNPSTGAFQIGDTADLGSGAYIAGNNTDIDIIADGGPIVTFKSGGDVGINQTSPTVKLDVVDASASRTWSHYFATVAAFERNGDSIVNIVSGNTGNASLWFGRSNSMVRGRIRYEQGNDKMELWTANSPKAYIDSSGNFHAIADVVAYSSSVSDIRLKDNINTIDSALDKVKKLRGVEYTWNAGSRKDKKDLGVIAQEVEEVLPDIVREHKMDFIDEQVYKTVDYEKITAVLIEAIKEQQKQIDELKNQLDAFTK